MDYSGRDREEEVFYIIRRPEGGAEDGGAGDGSEFLNDSGEGMELERRDEGQTNNDDEENVGALTKSGDIYILTLW